MDDTQILISLDDEKAKHLGDVISNKSCKKIINFLSKAEGTVTDISQKLKMRINTVDYNIKKLIKTGLIEKKSFWWSVKGKKMPVYKVSNKKIVISPKRFSGYTKYAFALIASGLVALVIRGSNLGKDRGDVVDTLRSGTNLPAESASFVVEKSSDILAKGGDVIVSGYFGMDVWLWFLFGAWFVILLFFVFSIFGERGFKG